MSEQNPTVSEILRDTQANLPKVEDYGYDPSTLLNTTSLLGTTYFVPSQSTTSNSGAVPFDESVVPGGMTGTEEGQGVPMTGLFTLGDATEASGAIRLTIADGKGDVYIASGKTDFVTTTAGFILGIDDSDSNKTKFYLGDATNYLYWDGSSLSITGGVSASSLDIGGSDATSWHVDSSGNMWSGDAAYASAPFKVSSGGAITSTSGTIGGFTIGASSLSGSTITGSTITGSTLQTGTSGANINITASAIELRNNTTVYGTIYGYTGVISGANGSRININSLQVDASAPGGGVVNLDYYSGIGTQLYVSGDGLTIDTSTHGMIIGDVGGNMALFVYGRIYPDNISVPASAGAPTGGNNNDMKLDTTNSRIYFKVSGTWKYAALT